MIKIVLEHNIVNGSFNVTGNVKPEKVKEIIGEYLYGQIGAGEDLREAEQREVYRIEINLDLTEDRFTVRHNCGNSGLMNGILLYYVNKE